MTAKADQQILEQPSLFEDMSYETNSKKQNRPNDKVSVPNEASVCTFCGGSVDPDDESTYYEVRTWVHGVKKDSSVLRTYTGLYACSSCITKLRGGVAPTQKDLAEILAEPAVSERATPRFETESSPTHGLGFKAGYATIIHGEPVLTLADKEMQDQEFANGYWDGVQLAEFELNNKMPGKGE
jgi:hypothetical protein